MISIRGLRQALVLGVTVALLGACTGKNHMVATATDTNLALEQSTNEMLLLNIIRASKQKPMYFTGLADVTMTDKASVGGTLSIPFGGDATNLYDFSPTFTFEAKPAFKVHILDNKEFLKALHTPVTLETYELFKGFGWPTEVLLYMLVDRFEADSIIEVAPKEYTDKGALKVYTTIPKSLEVKGDSKLKAGSILKAGSKLKAESTITPGAPLKADLTLQNDLTLNADSTLKAGSKLKAESTVIFDPGEKTDFDFSLNADIHIMAGSILEDGSILEVGSIFNTVTDVPERKDIVLTNKLPLNKTTLDYDAFLKAGTIIKKDSSIKLSPTFYNITYSRAEIKKRFENQPKKKHIKKLIEKIIKLERFKALTQFSLTVDSINPRKIIVGPVLGADAVEQKEFLTQILKLKEEGLSLEDACQMKTRLKAQTDGDETALEKTKIVDKEGILKVLDKGNVCDSNNNKKWYVVVESESDEVLLLTPRRKGLKKSATPTGTLVLRSPQGMLYFLGQISRSYLKDTFPPKRKPEGAPGLFGSRNVPLFAIRKGVALNDNTISVAYDGESYGVPDDDSLSMMSLSLISQLIALQKDPKSIPKSSTINIFSN